MRLICQRSSHPAAPRMVWTINASGTPSSRWGISYFHLDLSAKMITVASSLGQQQYGDSRWVADTLHSKHLTSIFLDWIRIATEIELNYATFDAFVILHGTDTMSYSSSALSFLLEDLGKTVVNTSLLWWCIWISVLTIFQDCDRCPNTLVPTQKRCCGQLTWGFDIGWTLHYTRWSWLCASNACFLITRHLHVRMLPVLQPHTIPREQSVKVLIEWF